MLAVIVNTIAIVLGSMIGLFFQAGIPKRVSDTRVHYKPFAFLLLIY